MISDLYFRVHLKIAITSLKEKAVLPLYRLESFHVPEVAAWFGKHRFGGYRLGIRKLQFWLYLHFKFGEIPSLLWATPTSLTCKIRAWHSLVVLSNPPRLITAGREESSRWQEILVPSSSLQQSSFTVPALFYYSFVSDLNKGFQGFKISTWNHWLEL